MIEREYAPGLSRRLVALAREMRELDDYIANEGRRELARRLRGVDRLDLEGFGGLPGALSSAMIREWLRQRLGDLRRVYRTDIERIALWCAAARRGSSIAVRRGWRLRCEYGWAVLEPEPTRDFLAEAIALARIGVTEADSFGFSFEARLLSRSAGGFQIDMADACARQMGAIFDADRIEGDLIVRRFRRGDRIQPLGMSGTRKVHDVFIDRKLPREYRRTWPIVEFRDEIVWIPGMVRSRIAPVTEGTEKLLQFKAKPRANIANSTLLAN